jgi:hypothetical protein
LPGFIDSFLVNKLPQVPNTGKTQI